MRIFAERVLDPIEEEIQYNIKFVSDCWRASIQLTHFLNEYPLAKIRKVLSWIPEADRPDDVIKGFSQVFECLDYLAKTCHNDKKSLIRYQKINDFAMALQSHYNEGS